MALRISVLLGGKGCFFLVRWQLPGLTIQMFPWLSLNVKNSYLSPHFANVYGPKHLPLKRLENSLLHFQPGTAKIMREFNSSANFLFNNIDFIIFTTYNGDWSADSYLTALCAWLWSASLKLLTSLSLPPLLFQQPILANNIEMQ